MKIQLKKLHPKQQEFASCGNKRKILLAGRRGGKTTVASQIALRAFARKQRVLYAAPTQNQSEKFWYEISAAFAPAISKKLLYAHNTYKYIEIPGTETRIRAKTAWNANTLRGDYADLLILDEYQMMNEDTWEIVGQPMLLDGGGSAIFIYTPPSLLTSLSSKARDKLHAAKFRKAMENRDGWCSHHFTSLDNPYLDDEALGEVKRDMQDDIYRMEILAEDQEESPSALWSRSDIFYQKCQTGFNKIVVGVDPSDYTKNSEVGIVVVGLGRDNNYYVISDESITYKKTEDWTEAVVRTYYRFQADLVLAETNFGGDMVRAVLRQTDSAVRFKSVRAARGKAIRAEPVVKLYKQRRVFHYEPMPGLETQMLFWVPKMKWSPDRLDALVWGLEYLRKPRSVGVIAA